MYQSRGEDAGFQGQQAVERGRCDQRVCFHYTRGVSNYAGRPLFNTRLRDKSMCLKFAKMRDPVLSILSYRTHTNNIKRREEATFGGDR